MSVDDYFDEFRPYLNNLIDSYRTQREWKVQSTMAIKFFLLKILKKIRAMYNPSDNIEILIGNKTDKIIEKLFDSLLKRYQEILEKSMKGIEFLHGSVDLLHYKLHRISRNRGGPCKDSPKLLKKRR